jgi:hypothetical protein
VARGAPDPTLSPTAPSAPASRRFVSRATAQAAAAPPEKGGLGAASAYSLRFYSTLPDTFENNMRVNLGLLPQDRIVAVSSRRGALVRAQRRVQAGLGAPAGCASPGRPLALRCPSPAPRQRAACCLP